jgi:uncharacterized coiled-coil protein SlyX
MVDRLTCVQNQVRVLEKINQELDEELHKSLQKSTAQGVRISTHEVTIGQQDIRIKKLEGHAAEGWELADSYTAVIDYQLEQIKGLQDTLAGLLPTVDDEENRERGIKRFWFTKR